MWGFKVRCFVLFGFWVVFVLGLGGFPGLCLAGMLPLLLIVLFYLFFLVCVFCVFCLFILVFSGLAAVCGLQVVLLVVLWLFMMAGGAWRRL